MASQQVRPLHQQHDAAQAEDVHIYFERGVAERGDMTTAAVAGQRGSGYDHHVPPGVELQEAWPERPVAGGILNDNDDYGADDDQQGFSDTSTLDSSYRQ